MPLPTTGPLSVWEIANEFGVDNQMALFYSLAEGIPASGLITIGHFRGKQFPTGQAVFTSAGTSTFTVPFAVRSISMVAVQAHGSAGASTVTVSGVIVCRAQNESRIGDGGGNGGYNGTTMNTVYGYRPGGAGGAGGYSGNGGNGGTYEGNPPTQGQGGGGAGGKDYNGTQAGDGGGVGLLGQGANGVGLVYALHGNPGSGGSGRLYGGGIGSTTSASSSRGGALSYKNNVQVTPGQTVTVQIGAAGGAVRIIWGKNRAYPSTNTHDM